MVNITNNFKKLGKLNLDEATEQPVMTVDALGDKQWRLKNGERHRTDGPAYESSNGDKSWWINGKRHRTDGPAIKYAGIGYKVWYIHDIQYSYEDWKVMVDILNNFKKLGKLNINEDI